MNPSGFEWGDYGRIRGVCQDMSINKGIRQYSLCLTANSWYVNYGTSMKRQRRGTDKKVKESK